MPNPFLRDVQGYTPSTYEAERFKALHSLIGVLSTVEAARVRVPYNTLVGKYNLTAEFLQFPCAEPTRCTSHARFVDLAVANVRNYLEHSVVPLTDAVHQLPFGRPDLSQQASEQVIEEMSSKVIPA